MKKSLLSALFVFVLIVANHVRVSGQGVFNMCSSITQSATDTSGTIYDSGGPTGDYQVDEDCSFLITPNCATSITLTVHSFNSEFNYDSLHVYDGPTTASPEVMFANDTTITVNPITCTSGYMLLVWHSDVSIVRSGFHATWTSIISSGPPTAAFTMGTTNAPLGVPVQFTDQSTGSPSVWFWYFGDGDTARSQNPTHGYSSPGTYPVTLIASTSVSCNYSDTIAHNITVQDGPQISVSPLAGFNASVPCGDTAHFNLDVSNIAGGQLVYNTDGSSIGKVKILAMSYGTNLFTGISSVKSAIHHYFNNDTIITTSTTVPGTLSGLLVGKNILLIPEQETGDPNVWIPLGPVIRQFVNNGGSVIFCGSYSSEANCMFNTGVFTGSYSDNEQFNTMHISSLADPLVEGLTSPSFDAPEATWAMNITNTDKVSVVDYQGDDIVTYRFLGAGKAIFIAFDYFDTNDEADRIIANAVKWGGENALPPWIQISVTGDTVDAGDTSHVDVSFIATGLPAGTYYANIGIGNNDPNNPLVLVPCTLSISGFPIIGLSENCLDFGQVMQHTTVRDTFSIINNGCDTLFLSSITSTNPVFSVNGNTPYLLPGAYVDVVVTLKDSAVELATGIINIHNNDNDTTICLTANVSPAPRLNSSLSSISQNIRACGDSATSTFTLSNAAVAGAVPLTYNLGNLPSWVTASPTSGSIPPGSSNTITLNFGSSTIPGGPQSTNLIITSNDPLIPSTNIPVIMVVNINPCISFTVQSNTCTGFSTFTTTTINTPTNYHWDFGDGDSSNVQSPSHAYAHNGTYTATLTACNDSGCDVESQVITAIITGPRATNCYPITANYVGGIGIILFQVSDIWGYRFNKATPDAIDSYKDYTCSDNATLVTNYPYSINITTGLVYDETVRMWLDMNNDGVLDDATERLYSSDTVLTNHSGTFYIPDRPSNVYGEPLRLRISSDYSGNPIPQPCVNLEFGQCEDYSVFLQFYDQVNEQLKDASFSVYPNPFNASTEIQYDLKKSSEVSVEVFNVLGDKVNSLASEELQSAGKHSYRLTEKSPGVYFVKLTIDGKTGTTKIIKM
jgi:PKD repeat protein